MPLNYLSGGQENVYALNRLGGTFSDMVIGLQQNRIRQQQFMAQQAMEQARLQLEREQMNNNELTARATRQKIGAQAQNERDIGTAGQSLGMSIENINSGRFPENKAMMISERANAARQGAILAATHPATIGVQIPQLMSLNDPIIRNLIATQSSATQSVAPGSTLYDVGGRQPLFTSPQKLSLQDPDLLHARIANEYARGAGALRGKYGEPTPAYNQFLDRALQAAGGGEGQGAKLIRVKHKDGRIGTIPAEQRDKAIQEGYTVLGEEKSSVYSTSSSTIEFNILCL